MPPVVNDASAVDLVAAAARSVAGPGAVVEVNSVGTVPAGLRSVALTDWTLQRDSISGLSHLEGREVAILTDGSVHPRRTVAGRADRGALGRRPDQAR